MAERHRSRHVEALIVGPSMAEPRRHPPDDLGVSPLIGKREEAANTAHRLSFGPDQGSRYPTSGALRTDDEDTGDTHRASAVRLSPSTFGDEIKNVGQEAPEATALQAKRAERLPRSPLPVETTHLLQRRLNDIAGERWLGDESIAPVANLVAGGEDDGHSVGLDQGEVLIARRDEPVPLRVREEAVPARGVRGRIRAAEKLGDERRRDVVVGGAATDAAGGPPGPAHDQRCAQLEVAEGRAVPREAQSVLVELHAVIRGDD